MKVLVVFTVLLISLPAFAANHAIRLDCSNNGNGANWNCASSPGGSGAYNTIPTSGTLVRGDTYYFSKGTLTLSYYQLADRNDGTKYITFKKATDSDYGGLSGWSSSLGNDQTIFVSSASDSNYNSIWRITDTNCGYYKWDGVYGSGPTLTDYGFLFRFGNRTPTNDNAHVYKSPANPTNIEFYHVAFEGIPNYTDMSQMAIFNGFGANCKFQYCLFDWLSNAIHGFSVDLTVDNCWFTNVWGGGINSEHGQQISYNGDRLTVSNCVFIDTLKTGGMTAFISFNDARNPGFGADGWKIYNNTFYGCSAGAGRIVTNSSSGHTAITNLKFYNNKIVDGGGRIDTSWDNDHVGSYQAYNNLYYNASIYFEVLDPANQVHDYNYWDSTCTNKPTAEVHGKTETVSKTDLFVDPNNNNYHIKKSNSVAIENGAILGSPYNIDKDGISRPTGSPWDIGAYQYVSPGTPVAPRGLRIIQ